MKAKTIVPRRARRLDDQGKFAEEITPTDLQEYRNLPAWVLLGEPGAGKTTVFEMEADATGGISLRIARFIEADIEHEAEWQGKTLFLDGLDEVRASAGSDSTLQKIHKQLKRLGKPPFRISCRAADWYGSSDAQDIRATSANGRIEVLQLEPLSEGDILTLLHDNHGIEVPSAFVEKAKKLGVAGLLGNPQTLKLLAEAVSDEQWPETRKDTYQLACEKIADEANKKHRDNTRNQPFSVERISDAAGQLFAVLLLSDKTGIALDSDRADMHFPVINDFASPDVDAAAASVRSKLFAPDGEERVVPSHRSVAEFLGARWLAQQIDKAGLPLGRALNLTLGHDGRTVAGLRGLYAWLALHCLKARSRLIEADPMTVIIYGDVKPMTASDKRALLAGLRREGERFSGFRWGTATHHPFGALADPKLCDDFRAALRSPARDEASQAYLDCVLAILGEGEPLIELVPDLLSVVRDETRWPIVRSNALEAWSKLEFEPQVALALLDDIMEGRVADGEGKLARDLFPQLYPTYLEPDALLKYLYAPRNTVLFGSLFLFFWFWLHELPRRAPEAHLPVLLDSLSGRTEIQPRNALKKMADDLLARGITIHGDRITDERLFGWLGIGTDQFGHIKREDAAQQVISSWIGDRPERYKSLLALCFIECDGHEKPGDCIDRQANRLHNASPPKDLGLWHFERIDGTGDEEVARIHLANAVNALTNQRSANGLSLEQLEVWADSTPDRKPWLESMLVYEIPEWRQKRAIDRRAREQVRNETSRDRTLFLAQHLAEIQSGTARVDVLYELANVWMGLYVEAQGESAYERFLNFYENGEVVLQAAESGFRHCIGRGDLPTEKEIVDLAINQKQHHVRLPCLIGMDLRWGNGAIEIDRLPDEALRRMLAFRLTYGMDKTPDWFVHLVRCRPALAADVLVGYASAMLKAGREIIVGLHPLEHDSEYNAVAAIAAPRLLAAFPVRARIGQLHYLANLLVAALRHTRDCLPAIIEKKLAKKGMDVAQRVYWLGTATMLDPKKYETALWTHIAESEVSASHLSELWCDGFASVKHEFALPASTIGKLIESLAPHAHIERPRDGLVIEVTDAMRRGEEVRALVSRLGAIGTVEAEQELERLLRQPSLHKLNHYLTAARHELTQRLRESEFRFLRPQEVAQVLANKAPTNVADLAALALDHMDDIARKIQQDNDDGFRAFWNVVNKKPTSQREENLCRDTLLTRLRAHLDPLGIVCEPEKDHYNDKRVDISLSYQGKFELPIEIKCDCNESLWTALRTQLIEKYSIAPRAHDFGIYLVLWFGGIGMPRVTDGGHKPTSAEELKSRLEAQLDPTERQSIFVRVLDVSWQ